MSKKNKTRDPHFDREAEKYEHPVPSREFILEYMREHERPVTQNDLLTAFDLTTPEEEEGLRRRLRAMERDGQVASNRRGSYGLVDRLELIAGWVQGHRDGFGFLIPDAGGPDIFLPARQMRQVFSNDRVLVRAEKNGGRSEGVIVEVLERNTRQVVGRFYKEDGVAFISPDSKAMNQDIIIPAGQEDTAKHGQFVVAEIIAQPTSRRQPQGKVIEILGDQLTPGMEVELAIRSHQLPFTWTDKVMQEAQAFAAEISPEEISHRRDLRDLMFVTIDGEDAKDFDDAVFCTPREKGWRLYVAIADVSYYVQIGSLLDYEAQLRGNSVYFPAKVIPMLPEILSNGLCSLKPKQDRLAMVCEMDISAAGEVTRYDFYAAVINSKERLTYTQVAALFAGDKSIDESLQPGLHELYRLYKKLFHKRQERGAIEFDTTETKIIFDDAGKIDCIAPVKRNDAHRLIEEMMLLANVCSAELLMQHKKTFDILYRVHAPPQEDRLTGLMDFLKAFGLRMQNAKNPEAKNYADLLQRVNKRPDAHLIQTVMLRSLSQAVYSPKNLGHFGLAYKAYTHFTSPIRRYPDLLVHRAIKYVLEQNQNKKETKRFPYTNDEMMVMGEHCSMSERRADLATRDAIDWLKCDYMKDKLGQQFPGRIVEVTGFGIFVELENIYVQGLVHVTALKNDYYHYDQAHYTLIGKRTGQTYRLGDTLRVLVARVDMDERKIDFDLA